MTTNTNNRRPTPEASLGQKPARRDISWGEFCELPGNTKSIIWNVYRTIDERSEWLKPASIRFLQKHGINRVYAPGDFPLQPLELGQ